jgi:hypothetical protein
MYALSVLMSIHISSGHGASDREIKNNLMPAKWSDRTSPHGVSWVLRYFGHQNCGKCGKGHQNLD